MCDHDDAEFAMAHTTLVVTYDAARKPVEHGSGFFLRSGSHHFVVTATHVLEAYFERRRAGEVTCVQLAVVQGGENPEEHEGYLLMPRLGDSDCGVQSEYGFRDIGLVELKPDTVKLVALHKRFVDASQIRLGPLANGAKVFYRGYPIELAEYHGPIRSVRVEGYHHFTAVQMANAKNTWLDRREEGVAFGNAVPNSSRNLRGISGSAVFDLQRRLSGVVWGGDATSTWACPAAAIPDCIAAYLARR